MQQIWRKGLWFTGGVVSLIVSLTGAALAQTPPASTYPQQNPPASTYQPGFWQPIARVDPHGPISVTLVNQTQAPLKYNFLDGRGEQNLPVGGSIQIKQISLPANIAIYEPSSSSQAIGGKNGSGLKFETSATNNAINVTVVSAPNGDAHVLDINKTGAIYVY
ncbi:MAG: hypothetical protein JOZ78_12290 [Chroococcidiopsidaceae cyanobacterium CP_BM_ER_R8_30]|nr:hypothetical protein [Chroococcidiopsidaceae cyanobacterium CP_BM_ER_R8_30]